MLNRLVLSLALLLPATPALAQGAVTLDFTARASKEQVIQLEPAEGAPVVLSVTEIPKTKEITIPFNVKRTGYFELPKAIPVVSPARINFGPRNPEKGWGLRLARIAAKEGKAEVTMKMGAFSMDPAKEFAPFGEDIKLPKAEKGADGNYVLLLPKALQPGLYAVVGFNGSAGVSLFSKKDGLAWVFEVLQPAAPAPHTAPAAPAPGTAPSTTGTTA